MLHQHSVSCVFGHGSSWTIAFVIGCEFNNWHISKSILPIAAMWLRLLKKTKLQCCVVCYYHLFGNVAMSKRYDRGFLYSNSPHISSHSLIVMEKYNVSNTLQRDIIFARWRMSDISSCSTTQTYRQKSLASVAKWRTSSLYRQPWRCGNAAYTES